MIFSIITIFEDVNQIVDKSFDCKKCNLYNVVMSQTWHQICAVIIKANLFVFLYFAQAKTRA